MRPPFAPAVVVVVGVTAVRNAWPVLARKNVSVGTGSDRFWADQRGAFVNAAVAALDEFAPLGATLAVIPEGVMVNYLTRRDSVEIPHLHVRAGRPRAMRRSRREGWYDPRRRSLARLHATRALRMGGAPRKSVNSRPELHLSRERRSP